MAQLLIKPKIQFFDNNGDPLVGGKVYTYEAGTTTPLATYTDKDAGTPNTNPVILDSRGEADIWLSNAAYKIVVHDSDDSEVYSVDDIKYINDGSIVTAMLADGAVTGAKIANGAVSADKLASGLGSQGAHVEKSENYTATSTDDIILINAIAQDVVISLPPVASSAGKILTTERIDDTDIKTDTFVDGDVTVGTETINIGSHPFYNLQRVQLTSSGTLPDGLSLATDYYIIYVDANNIKLASSKENAEVGTAVDITAASGGGTHTITSQSNTATVDAYLSELIERSETDSFYIQGESRRYYCDGVKWRIIGTSEHDAKTTRPFDNLFVNNVASVGSLQVGESSSGLIISEDGSNNLSFERNGVEVLNLNSSGIDRGFIVPPSTSATSDCGSFSTSSTSYVDVTNLSLNMGSGNFGRVVAILEPNGPNALYYGTTSSGQIKFLISTAIMESYITLEEVQINVGTALSSPIWALHSVGSINENAVLKVKVQAKTLSGTMHLTDMRLRVLLL